MRQARWLFPFIVVGCATLRPTIGREVTLMVYPHFAEKTEAILNPNTLATIATLDVIPYVETTPGSYSPISSLTGNPTTLGAADMLKLTLTSPPIDPDRPMVFRRLKPQKNYRIIGRAYNAANTQISLDASSYADVAVGNNDAPFLAQLPINLVSVPFTASTSVTVNTEGRFDYLKGTLYLVSGNSQVAIKQTSRSNPVFTYDHLQGNTHYNFVVEAYKLGGVVASNSLALDIANETAPSGVSLSLTVPYIVTTLAGSGVTTPVADGIGTAATFAGLHGIACDLQGNLYIADYSNSLVRKITSDRNVTTFAGNTAGFADGAGTSARFCNLVGITTDLQGNVYVGDVANNRIRKITPAGVVSTLAGSGVGAFSDGNGTSAMFNGPHGVAVDIQGNTYVAEHWNQCIRKVTPAGDVTTLAGNGTIGSADGQGMAATFQYPRGVAVDPQGYVYVSDWKNHRIRKITPGGLVSTLAGSTAGLQDGTGTAAKFNGPEGLIIDSLGNLFVMDRDNSSIRKVTPAGVVTTIAGNGVSSYSDGTGTAASFAGPWGIAIDSTGILYVADTGNQRVRKVQ